MRRRTVREETCQYSAASAMLTERRRMREWFEPTGDSLRRSATPGLSRLLAIRAAYVIFPVGASAICERAASPGSDSRICEVLSEL